MAFLSNMVGFGNAYAYGIFLKPLSTEFMWSRSAIAGAFSVYTLVHMILGFLAGRLLDKFGPRAVATVAGFFLGFTTFFMRYATSLWHVYLSYGLFLSLGVAFSYGPLLATVSRWFVAKRGFAVGLGTAGIGMGGFLFSPLCSWLIVSFGWRTAYLVIALLSWIIFIPVVVFLRDAPSETWKPIDTGRKYEGLSFSLAARTRTFWLLCLATVFATLSVWTIMTHMAPLASDRGIPPIAAGFLSGLIGGASIGGKVGAGFLSDKLGRKNL